MSRPLPLRTRLALSYTGFFALVLLLLCTGVYFGVRQTLRGAIDTQLETEAALIQNTFDASDRPLAEFFQDPAALRPGQLPPLVRLDTPMIAAQAATLTGVIVTRSASLREQQLPLGPDQLNPVRAGRPVLSDTQLGAESIRLISRPLLDNGQLVGVLQVAQPLAAAERTLNLVLLSLLLVGGVALLAAGRTGAWVAARALEPVREIARTAATIIRAEDLDRRLPPASAADEIGELTDTVNAMLVRLESLFSAQQRLVADVSHELRTPLAAMIGHLELLRRAGGHNPADTAESLADLEREAQRLNRLTADLLLLAQSDAGVLLRRTPLALDELVIEVVRDMRPLLVGQTLLPVVAEQVAFVGDRDRLKQALVNLVANAVQHTQPGGRIDVSLMRDAQRALLTVRDTGAGIAPEALPLVFERFYRADPARARASGGAGLGLTIVQQIAAAHGGGVTVQSQLGKGSTFTISLPLADH